MNAETFGLVLTLSDATGTPRRPHPAADVISRPQSRVRDRQRPDFADERAELWGAGG